MPDEIVLAEWKPFSELRHLKFTGLAHSICQLNIAIVDAVESQKLPKEI